MSRTAASETPREHCWHATMLGYQVKCCYCGILGHQETQFGVPDGHGPFAPMVLKAGVVVAPGVPCDPFYHPKSPSHEPSVVP